MSQNILEIKPSFIPGNRELRIPKVKSSLILSGFGLQALKTKLYDVGEEELDDKAPVGTSYLGTPVFMNIELEPGAYTDKKGNAVEYGNILKNNEAGDGFRIDTVLCDVVAKKQVITTKIQGSNGSVKEYISQDDYEITIRGALVDESGQRYPEEQVLQLVEYTETQESIKIYSRFLNDVFNIQYITVLSVSWPQVEGTQNVQLFEIKALSDDPIELTINGIQD